MSPSKSSLLNAFLDWAEKTKVRCRPDVKIDIIVGPVTDKQGVSMNLEDSDSASSIVLWSNGEFEYEYRNEDSSLDFFNYFNDVTIDQFDALSSSVLSKYSAYP